MRSACLTLLGPGDVAGEPLQTVALAQRPGDPSGDILRRQRQGTFNALFRS